MRPINIAKSTDLPDKSTKQDSSINDLYRKCCTGCYYTAECPQVYKHEKCPFTGDITVSLDRSTLQNIQVNLVENALSNLQKYENLFERGMVDDMDRLDKMRRTVFDLLEKLKKDAVSAEDTSILERLGIKSHGEKSTKGTNR